VIDGNAVLTSSGDLQSVDGYMNIALERCKEVAEGRIIRNWGDAFVRGNNGLLPVALVLLFR
jgi:U6 snRNA-associated Sm-like protein LSm6